MSGSSDSYIFSDAESARELARLRQLESVFDGGSQRILRRGGLARGLRCLEVGAGAGSIAAWLAQEVGPEGHVVAIDVNTRFLRANQQNAFEIIDGDIREYQLQARYDVIHARYVLVHLDGSQRALESMVRALAPGGSLILEEPDFLAARAASGPPELLAAFDRVNLAMDRMFRDRGLDPGFGLRLPAKLEHQGLLVTHIENDAHLVAGGSPLASMMRASAEQLASKYVATGLCTDEDVAAYCTFAERPDAWGVYYGTVRICAQRPSLAS